MSDAEKTGKKKAPQPGDDDYDYAAAEGVDSGIQKGGKNKEKTSSQSHAHSSRGVNV